MSELALKRIKEAKETRATRLDLGNCGLTELPDELFELTWLEELILSNEWFSYHNYPSEFHEIVEFTHNESQNFGKPNNIKKLSTNLSRLKKIKKLICRGNQSKRWKLNDISVLKNLKKLEYLDLEKTDVFDLTPLSDLKNIKELRLAFTKVKNIAPLIKQIENNLPIGLQWASSKGGISLESCPIENPPTEILNQGNNTILNYFKQIEKQGTVELYEAKLIIVGEGNTGKTTLFEKLKDNSYKLQPVDETHGTNIHEGLEFTHHLIGDNVFNANLWDFGGQELQYMTHQFFLTPRGLYVLMMNARKESPNLAYWFKIISLLGRDNQDSTERVKLLLVFNKRGNTTGTPQYQDQLKHYADTLDVQYLEVDFAENDYRFEALQKAIQQSLVTLPIVKSQLPRLWKVVREDLREEAKNNQYITTDRYSDMCSKHGITEEADQWLLSGYLHQLGSLLHFQNDKGLMHFVILSPQWATDGVYTFLSAESIKENNGRFTDIAFNQLLAAKGYKRADANLVLQLMTKNNFDICYEATEGNYVAAQLLPENRPDAFLWNRQTGAPLQFRYQYPIMPKGLMSRLIVRLSEYIEVVDYQEVVWKKGVILRIPTDKNNADNCSRVLMYEDDAESKSGLRQIIIEVMGNPQGHRKHALQRVREEVESLHKKWFRSIKADEMVPCCCSECEKSDNPQLFKLTNLLARRLKRNDTSCDMSGEDLLIQTLLDGVYDKGEIREMENMGRY